MEAYPLTGHGMAKGVLFFLLMTAMAPRPDCANANQALDRPFTLLNQEPFLLEAEYHRMIRGAGPRSYIFPRPCVSAQPGMRRSRGMAVRGLHAAEDPRHLPGGGI
jgi:hypothetical protein